MLRFENMFKQMDSIKSDMFRQTYPDGAIKRKLKTIMQKPSKKLTAFA